MRRIAIPLCGALLAAGFSVLAQARPVHADGGCNVWSDSTGTVYEETDRYRSARYWVWDSWDPTVPGHWVDIDLKAYRLSWYDGGCYRAYYVSTWTEDATPAFFRPEMRVWVCGSYAGSFDAGESFQSNRFAVSGDGGTWQGTNPLVHNITLWNGVVVGAIFGLYTCGPQADSYISGAWTNTWYNPQHIYSQPGVTWYVNGW